MWEWPTYVLSSLVFVFFSYVHQRYYRKKEKKNHQARPAFLQISGSSEKIFKQPRHRLPCFFLTLLGTCLTDIN